MKPNRRQFLGLAAGSTALPFIINSGAKAEKFKTAARIVIIGAGAAGTALANRLVKRLEGAPMRSGQPNGQPCPQNERLLMA